MIHLRDPDDATIRRVVSEILDGVRNRAALARTLGVNRAQIYNWMKGKTPSVGELAKLASATETAIRIDLGPVIDGPREDAQDTRLSAMEQQMTILMTAAVANQEAILRLLQNSSPSPG